MKPAKEKKAPKEHRFDIRFGDTVKLVLEGLVEDYAEYFGKRPARIKSRVIIKAIFREAARVEEAKKRGKPLWDEE